MVYKQRYYKEITHADGKVIRIEFWKGGDNSIAEAVELGPVLQSLNLEIQSGGDIDQPIVKTQLNFTLIDAPDHELSKTKKCGSWEEFYSPSATAWLVMVGAKKAGESGFKNIWGGYITPDSFRESLTYRAGVSFIARDNIGHMQDFPFDAEGNADGMITLRELIQGAWDKIASPMTLTIDTNNTQWLQTNGVNALDTYMNVSAFEDKNWYEALESVLYAYGLVMRYVGNNKVVVCPLRSLPHSDFGEVVPVFETGAERELSPAARRIEESTDFSEAKILPSLPTTNDLNYAAVNGVYYPLVNREYGKGWTTPTSDTLLLIPQQFKYESSLNPTEEQLDYINSHLYFGGSGAIGAGIKDCGLVYSRYVIPSPVQIDITLGKFLTLGSEPIVEGNTIVEYRTMITDFEGNTNRGYEAEWDASIVYGVSVVQNGITKWLHSDGIFRESTASLKFSFTESSSRTLSIKIDLSQFAGQVLFNFLLKGIGDTPFPFALEDFSIQAEGSALTKNTINTNYNEDNNVILSRSPKIAPTLTNVFLPALVENGIFRKALDFYHSTPKWSWNGTGAQQMAVYNHLQLLCYYAKPNNILSGTIVNADLVDFARVYRWQGAEHILTSGTFNLISGFIENATLREFTRYEDIWGDLTDEAALPEVESKSKTTAQGGTGTSSNASTYSNVTEVNIGGGGGTIVLDSYMSDSSTNGVQNRVIKAYVDSENAIQDESITTIIQSVLEQGATLAAMWKLSDDGSSVKTEKNVLIKGNTAIHSGNIGSQSVDAATRLNWNGLASDVNTLTKNGIYSFNTGTSNRPVNHGVLFQLSNKDNPSATDGSSWIYQIAGGTGSTSLYVRKSINGASWSNWETIALLSSNVGGAKKLVTSGEMDAVTIADDKAASFLGNIKIQPANRDDVSLSFISGVESGQFYDYKIGKFTDANAISGFGIAMANANGAWVKFLSLTTDTSYNVTSVDFLRELHAKKDAYFSGHMYVGASSNLMLGDKTAGIYITYNAISWHNDSNSYSSSIFGFDSAAIRVYKTLRPNTNQLCALGSSSYRWSGVHAVTGDFSGDVSVKGNLIVMGDVASA